MHLYAARGTSASGAGTLQLHGRALRDLRRVEATLARLVQQCGRARGTVSCPLISALRAR